MKKTAHKPQNKRTALWLGLGSHCYLLLILLLVQNLMSLQSLDMGAPFWGWFAGSALSLTLMSYASLRWLQTIWPPQD